MKKIILIYGAISGTVAILGILAGFQLAEDGDSVAYSQWLGYLIMLIALSMIFVGIKRYRDQDLGGVITFGNAALLGLGIAAMAGVMYVLVWEIYLATTDYEFIHNYTQSLIAAREAEGLSGAALESFMGDMAEMVENYSNPSYRLPLTFLEIFPVGLVITLISAAILRNRNVLPAGT